MDGKQRPLRHAGSIDDFSKTGIRMNEAARGQDREMKLVIRNAEDEYIPGTC